jgi:pimeloyl-ACP methyl ester carboxylesterase
VIVASTTAISVAQPSTGLERDATVYGFKIHYAEAGQGPTVILLHGLGGDISRWAPTIAPLAKTFRVLVPDQIGFGNSDKPLANYHVGMLSDFLVGFMKAVGVARASLVGNSMGAFVAAYTAVHHPDLVDRLVLVDGAGYGGPRTTPMTPAEQHRRQIQNGVTLDETREFFRIMWFDKSRVTDTLVEQALTTRLRSAFAITKIQEAGDKGLGAISPKEMASITSPTLVVWGAHDELISPTVADRLVADIPGARKILIEDAGHLPQLERPDEFNEIVGAFLAASK